MKFPQLASLLVLLQGFASTNSQFRPTLYRRLPKCGDDDCHCTGEDTCPALPVISQNTLTQYGTLTHANPLIIRCDPFASDPLGSTSCVNGLENGQACVVEMIAPVGVISTDPCPAGWSYNLVTVPSLERALADGMMVTHTGPCGACSSLQDLKAMLSTDRLPMQGNNCYWRSNALADQNGAQDCFKKLGFTDNCARTLMSYQRRVNSKCGAFCAAFALGDGQDSPSCEDSRLCVPCSPDIVERFEVVAGRTFINSGFPAWSAVDCSQIASSQLVYHGDVCQVSTT